ncbi:MAG: DUF368 domain-containing protein [Gammaproteobacteria bacterium]|nr:DUF368 domain-containing protein [Gammaproteobacteria bacterium]
MVENKSGKPLQKNYPLLLLKGMAMGAADSVPGVSGGTIAVIARIYDELIYSIRSIDTRALKLLISEGIKPAWDYINGTFLVVLLCGIVVSLRISAGIVLVLLDNYFEPLMAFFIGLVISSCWFLKAEFGRWNGKIVLAIALGMTLTLLVGSLSPQSASVSNWYLYFCGLIAICAMILPGLSGAFLLLLLGVYDYMLGALVSLEIVTIAVFIAGCVTGLLLFSRVLAWALKHYRNLSYAFLSGMLLASAYVLWPWQMALSYYTDREGQSQMLEKANVWPGNYESLTGLDPQLVLVLLCLVGGCVVIVGFNKLFRDPVD